MAGGV
ncbi:hypothetical protein YPPY13_4495, partial [Yersinia pestis PY-13]